MHIAGFICVPATARELPRELHRHLNEEAIAGRAAVREFPTEELPPVRLDAPKPPRGRFGWIRLPAWACCGGVLWPSIRR